MGRKIASKLKAVLEFHHSIALHGFTTSTSPITTRCSHQHDLVEETFKTLKSDLDIRPVYHKTDDASKAHLNLAVWAYWVVSTTKYMLKKKGTQQRVTLVAEQDNGHILKVRRSTTPEAKLAEIQDALGITPHPVCSIKSVWLREQPPEKHPP